MGLLVYSFVFLAFSEPAKVLSSPISLSETGHPKGSEFACLLRKVSQSDRGWKYSRDINVHRAVISKGPPALLWHMRGCTWACEPDAPINSKNSSPVSCSHDSHPQAPVHLSVAVPPSQGTESHAALQAESPAQWGRWNQAPPPQATPLKHVPLGYQHLVCTL